MATEQLEAETCTLAARLAATTCRFLMLIGELERREAWRSWGCRSLAHWLSWQCALGLGTAREHVRVATALAGLPLMTETFARGELSYSKVRALTRITDLDEHQEEELVGFAQIATAAQVERTVAAYRTVVQNVNPDRAKLQHERQQVRVLYNDDGMVTITARLAGDVAVVVLDAIDQAGKAVPRAGNVPAGTLRADGLELMARTYLQPDGHAAPATQIVIHTDQTGIGCDAKHAIMLSIEAVQRLSCDASVRNLRDDAATSLDTRDDAGRKHRQVPRRLRRKLVRRDGDQCRFTGCPNRHYLHAHHVQHWTQGGATDLDNLVLLCSYHHRLVHEGGWNIEGNPNQPLTYLSPDGKTLDEHPRRLALAAAWRTVPYQQRRITGTAINTAHGERLDLHLTISALCCLIPPDRN